MPLFLVMFCFFLPWSQDWWISLMTTVRSTFFLDHFDDIPLCTYWFPLKFQFSCQKWFCHRYLIIKCDINWLNNFHMHTQAKFSFVGSSFMFNSFLHFLHDSDFEIGVSFMVFSWPVLLFSSYSVRTQNLFHALFYVL